MSKTNITRKSHIVARYDGTTLHSVRSFCERHPGAWPSEGALRFLISTRRGELRNAGAVLSPPGVQKILIDERKFFAWLRGECVRRATAKREAA